MTMLLTFLATAAGKWIVAALGVVVAIVAAWLKGRISGAKAERANQAVKERDAYEQHLHDIEAASAASNTVRPDDGGMRNDPNNRDRKS